jgi:YfiH family protein
MTTIPVTAAFTWVDRPDGAVLEVAPVAALAPHAFTTRRFAGGRSTESGTAPLVRLFEPAPSAVVSVRQVHGGAVFRLSPGVSVPADAAADAILSTDTERAIAVAAADCVPILIADRRRRAVAAVHAGWRGTAVNVAGRAVAAFGELGVEPDDLVAAIGPSIGPCCYQVDAPVRDAFLQGSPGAKRWFIADGARHWKLDLWGANAAQLESAGVPAEAIHTARVCTRDHPQICYSYRREGPGTGRLWAAIRLLPPDLPPR